MKSVPGVIVITHLMFFDNNNVRKKTVSGSEPLKKPRPDQDIRIQMPYSVSTVFSYIPTLSSTSVSVMNTINNSNDNNNNNTNVNMNMNMNMNARKRRRRREDDPTKERRNF